MLFPVAAIAVALSAISPVAANVEDKIEKRMALRTHSLAPPYVDTDLQNRWWDFGEDALINTNKHVRLTQDRQSEKGYLWSRMPIVVPNWQIEFEFKVDGKQTSFYGDGFAVWLTKDRAITGKVFGNQDQFTGLGIFFDTYANSRHSYSFPRVTAMVGDGQKSYDLDHDNAEHEIAACSENFRHRDVATKARLTYIKGHGVQLDLHLNQWDNWVKCFEISDVILPESPFIGFTAATGDAHDNHDIISVQTSTLTLLPQYRAVGEPPQKAMNAPTGTGKDYSSKGRKPQSSSSGGVASWFLFLLKLIGVLAFVAFAIAAYRTYSAQKRTRPAYY